TDAKAKLTEALAKLPALAKAQETGSTHPMAMAFAKIGGPAAAVAAAGGFALELDDLIEPPSPATIPPVSKKMAAAMLAVKAKPLSETVTPRELDPPTAVDDPDFLAIISAERNLKPEFIKALKKLY